MPSVFCDGKTRALWRLRCLDPSCTPARCCARKATDTALLLQTWVWFLHNTGLLPRCAWRLTLVEELILPHPGWAAQGFDSLWKHSKTYWFPHALDEGWEENSIPWLWVFVLGTESFIEIASISIIVAFKFWMYTRVIAVFHKANLIKQAIF